MRVCTVLVFEKRTNLLLYYDHKINSRQWNETIESRAEYSKERTVTLLLSFGVSKTGNLVAKINCPINPLPVMGEFEYPTSTVLIEYLEKAGWSHNKYIHPNMFRIVGRETEG